ncbi:hypothetical protein TNCV_3372271 [Trichonephila clavipes]|nr:hypothetical protein TNCV_3372271 [Trichonephila clavipes]
MEWYEEQPECYPTQLLLLKRIRDLAAEKRRCTMCPVLPTAWIIFGFPKNRVSELCPAPIDSDERRSTKEYCDRKDSSPERKEYIPVNTQHLTGKAELDAMFGIKNVAK